LKVDSLIEPVDAFVVGYAEKLSHRSSILILTADSRAGADALITAVQLLAPLSPHIAQELWAAAGQEGFVAAAPWPDIEPRPHPEHLGTNTRPV
jgi:leucyl-tRNA synthetase